MSGVRLNVERLGPRGGPTVVFVHGILGDDLSSYYFTVASMFAAAGHDVVLYDQRGHGRSDRPASGYTLAHFTDDLSTVLDRQGVTAPVYLVGNSFGGSVVLDFTLRHPDRVAGAVVVESVLPCTGWALHMSQYARTMRDLFPDDRSVELFAEEHGRRLGHRVRKARPLLFETSVADDLAASTTVDDERWLAVDTPVLAVYGDRSGLSAVDPALDDVLPNCRTVVVEGFDHTVLVDAPRTVGAMILDWVRACHQKGLP